MPGTSTTESVATPAICRWRHRIDAIFSSQFGQELWLSFPSHRQFIPPVISTLLEFCERNGLLIERERMRAAVALEEALVNAVIHGNLEVNSKLRDSDDGSFERLVASRLEKAPYQYRVVQVAARYSSTEVSFTIQDEGPGFDVSCVPDPRDPGFTTRAHGRGLLLMRTFMDKVTHNKIGNQVTLTKRRNRS